MQKKQGARTAKGAGPASKISRRQILQAAREYYFQKKSQATIAAGLGISASYLARKLAEAEAEGLIRHHIEADRDDEVSDRLKVAFPSLRRVEVVHGGGSFSRRSGSHDEERTADEVAQAVAQLVDERLEKKDSPRIAIGGGRVHRLVVDKLEPRKVQARIGPTALTPYSPGMGRFTAPLVASLLAHRLGVLDGAKGPDGVDGELCDMSVSPNYEDKKRFQQWWEGFSSSDGYAAVVKFWRNADLVLLGVGPISKAYPDVRERLAKIGRPIDEMGKLGAVGTCANQFFDASGRVIDVLDGIAGYEPAISLDTLRHLAKASDKLIVLDVYGRDEGRSARPLATSGVCNVVVCDSAAADALLE